MSRPGAIAVTRCRWIQGERHAHPSADGAPEHARRGRSKDCGHAPTVSGADDPTPPRGRGCEVLRYAAVAAASKAFSATVGTRRLYRALGKVALERIRLRSGLLEPYVNRSRRLIALCDQHSMLRPGDEVLELGTGWLHWEATVLRLFFDVRVTLYDIQDNRLFATYLAWVEQFGRRLAGWSDMDEDRRLRATDTIEQVLRTTSFEEVYQLLGFRYVVEPDGRLDGLRENCFALVVSADVLEHIPRKDLAEYLASTRARLASGGHAVHQIDLVDHYHYFDPTTSPKHYYRYGERTWQRWFSNELQYINRVQRPEWRRLFDGAGFERVEEQGNFAPLGWVPTIGEFARVDQDDVDCLQMITVHRDGGR